MLYWSRARSRRIGLALLVSLSALGASSIVPHDDDCHGEGCVFVVEAHDPSRHAIGPPSSPADHPLHCVVCHWTRLHRPSVELVHHFVLPVERPHRVPVATDALAAISPAAQPPLRSPPLASTIA